MLNRRCLNKYLGKCPDCVPDFDASHHPNNLDCVRYSPIPVIEFLVYDLKNLKTECRYGDGKESV